MKLFKPITLEDIKKFICEIYRERELEIVKTMSRGNYSLSQGNFVTAEELDAYFGPYTDNRRRR